MRFKNFIVFFLFNVKCIFSQKATLEDNSFCLKIAPLSIFDIYSGMSPRIGMEYKVRNNFTMYNEIGTYVPNANAMHNNIGYLTKFEPKLYLNYDGSSIGNYVSAEVFFKHQSYYTNDTILNSSGNYSKDYHVSKNVGCFTIKYGFLKSYKNRILIDYFIGIGIRQKYILSSLSSDENKNIKAEGDYHINILKNQAGIFTTPNFDIGIKVGYSFR